MSDTKHQIIIDLHKRPLNSYLYHDLYKSISNELISKAYLELSRSLFSKLESYADISSLIELDGVLRDILDE